MDENTERKLHQDFIELMVTSGNSGSTWYCHHHPSPQEGSSTVELQVSPWVMGRVCSIEQCYFRGEMGMKLCPGKALSFAIEHE